MSLSLGIASRIMPLASKPSAKNRNTSGFGGRDGRDMHCFISWAQPCVRGDGIWGDRYPIALTCAKIALGLLSKRIPETTTTRTFEIPATGTFMLAERNTDHLAHFEEGKEAEFFTSDDELRDKIRFYLRHDAARIRIAAAGRERCLKSAYSHEHQMRRVFERLRERNRTAVALSPSVTDP